MATHYVDWSGAAGNGDGSSFANRSAKISTLTFNAGDEVRIKKSPDPTSLGTGKVKKTLCHGAYNPKSQSTSPTYSTTEGETSFPQSNNDWQGWETGDVIHFWGMSASDAAAGKNINGLHTVTSTDNWDTTNGKVKIDGFTAANTTAYSGAAFKWRSVTSNSVVLNTADITKSIACRDAARTAWTASSNVTCTTNVATSNDWTTNGVDWQVGTGSDKIVVESAASSGKAAYWATGTLDLSGYQQISMLIRCSSGSDADADHSIRLCTDTSGETSVHTIPINMNNAHSGHWYPLVVDLGTNLNSAIKSIALYVDTTGVNKTYYIQNIIACKASSANDSLTHRSLIGLNTTADPVWYPIGFIWDKIILLRTWNGRQGAYGYYMGDGAFWSASNNSATIYKREAINTTGITSENTNWDKPSGSGNTSNRKVISGGWNSTDMSSQDGLTFIRSNGQGRGLALDWLSHYDISKIHTTGWKESFKLDYATYLKIWDVGCSDAKQYNIYLIGNTEIAKCGIDYAFGCYTKQVEIRDTVTQPSSFNKSDFYIKWAGGGYQDSSVYLNTKLDWSSINAEHSGQYGLNTGSSKTMVIDTLKVGYAWPSYCMGWGSHTVGTIGAYHGYSTGTMGIFMNTGSDLTINTITHDNLTNDTNNSGSGRRFGIAQSNHTVSQNSALSKLYINDGTMRGRMYNYGGSTYTNSAANISTGGVFATDYDGVSGALKNFLPYGKLEPETSIRHTASGKAWKFTMDATGTTQEVTLGQIVVAASSLVTVSLWVYLTNTSNVTGKLIIKGEAPVGLTSDISVDTSGVSSNNTWTKITKTFTPTAAGTVDIAVSCSTTSTSQYLYIDDLEVSQA